MPNEVLLTTSFTDAIAALHHLHEAITKAQNYGPIGNSMWGCDRKFEIQLWRTRLREWFDDAIERGYVRAAGG